MPRLGPAYLGTMPVARLSSRALIAVTGPEARPFLHNLLTQDVETLGEGELRFGALLSPPGRLLFDLFILGQAEGVLLDVAADRRDALIQRLSMYRLRAKVQVAADDRPVFAAWPDAPQDKTYPIEADFDLLNGIDFHKGCFVGQETTSRMKRRGSIKNRMLALDFDGPPPPFGAEVLKGELRAGEVLSGRDGSAMALLRIDRLDGDLTVEGRPVRLRRPAWMGQDVLPSSTD